MAKREWNPKSFFRHLTPDALAVLLEWASVELALDGEGPVGEQVYRAWKALPDAERETLWRVRRELSMSLKTITPIKHNHDVVVPKARIPELFELVQRLAREHRLRIPCFGHIGDGNVHVNVTGVAPDDETVDLAVLEAVVARGGSISAEHGVGRAKARWLHLQRSPAELAMMRAVKSALDPRGLLNPGCLFA